MPPSSQKSNITDHAAGTCWKFDRGTYMYELACEIAGIKATSNMKPSSFDLITFMPYTLFKRFNNKLYPWGKNSHALGVK